MARQLSFDLPTGVSLEASDFFVSDANAGAFAMLQDPAGWPQGKLILSGPEGSGKSHLARIVADRTGARIVAAGDVDGLHPDGPLVVEDVDRLPRDREEALFHLHNHMVAHRLPLLLTARGLPGAWNVALPDLASRLAATVPVRIAAPDDRLLQALILKLFADRQILPPDGLVPYLAGRIDRSYAGAHEIVTRLDNRALETRRPIGKRLAAEILSEERTDE